MRTRPESGAYREMAMKATSTSTSRNARARSARKIDAPLSTPTSTTPSGWSAVISPASRATVSAMAASSRRVSTSITRRAAGSSLGERFAHRLPEQRGAQLPAQRGQLAQLLLETRPGLGVPLAHVRQQDLAEQHGFAVGEVAVHAEMAG